MGLEDLAVRGGQPHRTTPLPGWPQFDEDEVLAATAVLRSGKVNFWTGDHCRRFEAEYAEYLGVPYAISLANGTLALELGLRALGIGEGDEVVVPAKTFIASASAVMACGARPVICDVDPVSQNLTVETLQAVMTPRTKGVVVVHLGGWPADMPALMAFADKYRLLVIEDCAQAHGAEIAGQPVGSFGHCSAFSFCQDKIVTTGGEGGLLATRDPEVWRLAWEYKDHGKSYELVHQPSTAPGFRWLHASFGSNMRMTEFQAAIGRLQLQKLDQWQARREANALRFHAALKDVPGLLTVEVPQQLKHAWYRYYAFLDLPLLGEGWGQGQVVEAIAAEGVPCFVGSCSEIYREQAFSAAGVAPAEALPNAQQLSLSSIAFLVHPTLTPADIDDVVAAVRKVMSRIVRD